MADLFFGEKYFHEFFAFLFAEFNSKHCDILEGNLKEIHACLRDAIYLVAPPALFVWHNKGIIQTQYGSWVSAPAAEFDRLPTQNSCFNPSPPIKLGNRQDFCCLSFFFFGGLIFPSIVFSFCGSIISDGKSE